MLLPNERVQSVSQYQRKKDNTKGSSRLTIRLDGENSETVGSRLCFPLAIVVALRFNFESRCFELVPKESRKKVPQGDWAVDALLQANKLETRGTLTLPKTNETADTTGKREER